MIGQEELAPAVRKKPETLRLAKEYSLNHIRDPNVYIYIYIYLFSYLFMYLFKDYSHIRNPSV